MKEMRAEGICAQIFDTRDEMGAAAAKKAAEAINKVLSEKEYANVIFAAAPSQNETLLHLLKEQVDFTRVRAFHMDEYVGLPVGHPQSFSHYLAEHMFDLAPFNSIYYVADAENEKEMIDRYTKLLQDNPPDVVCMGIGENGHIAFNDPPVADFNDAALIKRVTLDEICRMQQVHDKCFATLDDVPKYALTLTVPTLMSAKYLICTVPGKAKAEAVYNMMNSPIGESCPATALRKHENAYVFLDADSAEKLA